MPKRSVRVVQKSDRILRSHAHTRPNMEGDNVSNMDYQESSGQQETGLIVDQDAAQTGDPIVQANNPGQAVAPETSQNVPIVVPVNNDTNDNQNIGDSTGSTLGQQSQFMIEIGGALVPVSFQDWLAYRKLEQEREQREADRSEKLALEREQRDGNGRQANVGRKTRKGKRRK